MNFIMEFWKRITTALESQLTAITSFMVQVQNWGNRAAQVAQQKVQKAIQTLLKKPNSKEDYWRFGGLYFSKRFVVMACVVVGVIGFLFVNMIYPWAEGKLWTANIGLDTEKYTKFEGRARVYDQMGVMVYEGSLSKGHPEGYGIQYTADGKVIYKGNFEGGKYKGKGERYNSEGIVIYDGMFENNLYQGEGKLFNDIGKMIYMGSFDSGMRSGYGVEFDPDTNLKKYQGSFENDVRSGNGVEFEADGTTIKYTGMFKDGVYSGTGKAYVDNILLYEGEFANGVYDGQGTLYDLDMGTALYVGEFKAGLYNGEGTLYDPSTSVIIYKGTFSAGKKQGEGTAYDKLGSETFSGKFRSDGIDYISYLGANPGKVTDEFGEPSYKTETDGRMILTYLSLDTSAVFKVDQEKGEYVCEKIILGVKNEFMGLGTRSTAIERRNVMGEPYSSINYSCPSFYKTVFSNLSININDISSVPTDKYIMDKYFVRFYFNEGRTELKCVEIGALS